MYKKEGLKQWSEKNISGLIGLLECELENLKPGNYVVQVVAVNKYGSSHASKSKMFTVVLPTSGKGTYIVYWGLTICLEIVPPFYIWKSYCRLHSRFREYLNAVKRNLGN